MISRSALAVAANAALSHETGAGCAVALNAEDGKAPEWIQLIPNGRLVVGRDGRRFSIFDPAAIIAVTEPYLPLVIDYEHDFENRAPGQDTPAAGWVEELQVRDGSIWGRAAWATRAANAIVGREYRFISPVFFYRRDTDPMEVVALGSAGLTHRPNLDLKALNTQETSMDPQIAAALGLAANSTLAAVLVAIEHLKADNLKALNSAANPPLDKFVPAAQHQATADQLAAANKRLGDLDKETKELAVVALVDEAVKVGKIAPAARDGYLDLARNSFELTKAAIEKMPVVLTPGVDPAANTADPTKGAAGKLTDTDKAICEQMGLSEEGFLKARNSEQKAA